MFLRGVIRPHLKINIKHISIIVEKTNDKEKELCLKTENQNTLHSTSNTKIRHTKR